MTDGLYRETLDAAKAEMESLLEEESKIEGRLSFVRARIDVLRKTIISVGDLLGEDREPQAVGISDAIRRIMSDRPESFFSPAFVRDVLKRDEFPLCDYKNPLAVIHATMKRLEDQEELTSITRNSKTYYKWAGGEFTPEKDIPF